MTKNKKYQIFISSTFEDLQEERNAVVKAILKMKHFPVGMEMFNAGNDQQWKIITDRIDSSDYYVLILGQRYGSILDRGKEKGISCTEREYRYATKKNIPVIAFLLSDDADIKKSTVETDPDKANRLEAFKTDVKSHHMVEWFKSPEEFAKDVTNSLYLAFDDGERPGWYRSDDESVKKIAEENAELSKENRLLRERISELERKASDREPILSVDIGIDKPYDKDDEQHSELFKLHRELK